jgi:intein/homing endonuclease
VAGKKYISREKYMIRIGSHEIYNDLVSLGITPHKSKTICLPKVPSEYLAAFLRGYLDGDGCINLYKKRLSVTFT